MIQPQRDTSSLKAGRESRTLFAAFVAVQTIVAWSEPFFAVGLVWVTLQSLRTPGLLGAYLGLINLGQILMLAAGGVIADLAGAKRVLSITLVNNGLLVLLTSAYALLLPHVSPVFLYLVALLTGANSAVARPASARLLPSLVNRERLQAANGLLQLSRQLGNFVGPLLAGALVARLGGVAALWIEGVCLLVAGLGFSILRIPREAEEGGELASSGAVRPSGQGRAHLIKEVIEGLNVVRASRFLAAVLAFSVAGNLALEGPLRVAVPYLVQAELGRPTADYAVLLSLFGAGGVVGATLTAVAPTPRNPGLVVLGLWGLLGISLAMFGTLRHWVAALVTMGIVGATVSSATVLVWATLQAQLQRQIVGRVSSLILLASLAPGSVSLVMTGWLSTVLGPAAPLVLGGTGIVVMSALAALVPEIRQGTMPVATREPTHE